NARFAKNGNGVFMTSDQGSEFQRLVFMNLTSKKTDTLTPELNWDVDEFDLSKDGRRIAFEANEDGISMLHVLDTATRREVALPKLPVGVLWGVQWHANGHEFGFSLSTASQPYD